MTCTSGKWKELNSGIQTIIDQRDHFYQALLYIQRRLIDTNGVTNVDEQYINEALMAIDLALMELPNEKDSCTNCNTCACN